MEFRLPALGEGIDAATVVGVLVKPGETVSAGQNVLSVETDKAAVEVPIEDDGTIEEIHVKPGDKIPVGGTILSLKAGASKNGDSKPTEPKQESKPTEAEATEDTEDVEDEEDIEDEEDTEEDTTESADASGGSVDVHLPALGEGIDAATVVGVLVNTGDQVTAGQNVLAVETDKAAVEVPVEEDGVVAEIHVKSGDKVPVGQRILTLTTGKKAPAKKSPSKQAPKKTKPEAKDTKNGAPPAKTADKPAPSERASKNGEARSISEPHVLIPAGPATRRLARELSVKLQEVRGTGRGGRVTLDDIKEFIRNERQKQRDSAGSGAGLSGKTVADSFTHPSLPDFSKFGEIEKKQVASIRQTIAKNLTIACRTMPMVTQHDLADITELEGGRKRISEGLPKGTAKITWTVLAVKAVVAVLKEFPHFNSSFDMNTGELILKKYYNIGIAVDTERGLVVPVIKDADKKTIRDVAQDVTTLAEKARTGKLTIDEMRGGTFTITNLGGIGGTNFTPIVNYPEVAILGLSRSSMQPVVRDGQIVPRLMMPMSLTYDHRVIDGADGARFTTRLAQLFSDPIRLLMES